MNAFNKHYGEFIVQDMVESDFKALYVLFLAPYKIFLMPRPSKVHLVSEISHMHIQGDGQRPL